MVYVGAHNVAGGFNHTSVIMFVDQDSEYYNHPDFLDIDGEEIKYATIGAGRVSGELVSGLNRIRDFNLSIKAEFISLGEINDGVIGQLFELEANYEQNVANPNNSIRYQLFPRASNDRHNSNSFISGLLNAAGFNHLNHAPTLNVPGWDKPVPREMFFQGGIE